MGHQQLVDGMYNDGMMDAFYNVLMGVTAENIAEMYNISREEQDEFALMSHQRACNAINNKTQASELIPVEIKIEKRQHLLRSRRASPAGPHHGGPRKAETGL